MIDLKNTYDIIFIGSSPLSILEASSKSYKNKKILIIESNKFVGGSWSNIDIFDLNNVENAIHYFLPSFKAIKFMKNKLKLNVVKSSKKYRVLKKSFLNYSRFHYDNFFGKILSRIHSDGILGILSIDFFLNLFNKSYYLKYGSKEISHYISNLIKKNNLPILLNKKIVNINIISKDNYIEFIIKDNSNDKLITIKSKKMNITHGLKINRIDGDLGSVYINHLRELRPHLHLLINDKFKNNIKELIFDDNNYVKYIHDVTGYIKDIKTLNKDDKIFILALKTDVKHNQHYMKLIINVMRKNDMLSDSYVIKNSQWTDIYLPELSDNDLQNISNKYRNQVQIMFTENFTKSIELYHNEWYE